MRILLALLVVLVVGLLAQALFDRSAGGWAAVAALFAILVVRLVGWLGVWPFDSADGWDGGD